jgi:hypothetical protein
MLNKSMHSQFQNPTFDSTLTNRSRLIDEVVEQVSIDLKKILNSSAHFKNKLRMIAEKMEIDKKTLLRISEKGSKPNYITVFKIYRYILNEFDDAKVLLKCPEVIRLYLKNANPQTLEKNVSYTSSIDKELNSNPIFAEIYVLCSTGPLAIGEVEFRFGVYGINLVEKMLKINVLAESRKGEFILGPNQAILKPETIFSIGSHISSSYAKPENGYELDQNLICFYAEGLTEEVYNKWIKIDHEASKKKIELANKSESKGTKRAFTFCVTDTLDLKESDK